MAKLNYQLNTPLLSKISTISKLAVLMASILFSNPTSDLKTYTSKVRILPYLDFKRLRLCPSSRTIYSKISNISIKTSTILKKSKIRYNFAFSQKPDKQNNLNIILCKRDYF